MANIISMHFSIGGAKDFDYGEDATPNWQYLDTAETIEEALEKWRGAKSYPIIEFAIVTVCDDNTMRKVGVLDGFVEDFVKKPFKNGNEESFVWEPKPKRPVRFSDNEHI